jgi:deoxyribodipyrimidine photo-lyase
MPDLINASRRGARAGWWGLPEPVEAFLDQIITWRELGFNNAFHNPEHNDYNSIPKWAKITLSEHADDERTTYTLEQIRNADTHDEIWNAAQRQLVRKGIIHNYLRMLWGKRILEWAESPEQAAEWMIELNDTYALDGRDPNSYTGIFWVLGRHDRAWGPERAIFGKIRYMSSENTRRKFDLKPYLQEFGH